ncbi:MAG TPA: hypothetical protein VEY11_20720 [Pyrinomonadaceae bacterium]|nr:hypothetical protein [Pyrinomonadaceae bacterium]
MSNSESKLPPPNRIGKRGTLTEPVTGNKKHFRVIDEVIQIQSDYPTKAIYLQKIEFEKDRRIELRFGYYIIGMKPGRFGKWVWGQFAPLMPIEDFERIVEEAKAKGLFDVIQRAG